MRQLVFLLLIAMLAACSDQKPTTSVTAKPNQEESIQTWQVISSSDNMRNTQSKWLATRSINNADLSYPYDGVNKLQLDVQGSRGINPKIFLTIDRGQYDCRSYGCKLAVMFGSAEIQYISFRKYDVAAGDGTVLILRDNSKAFLKNLRGFNSITIEIPFYKNAVRQFKFDTQGFNDAEAKIDKSI